MNFGLNGRRWVLRMDRPGGRSLFGRMQNVRHTGAGTLRNGTVRLCLAILLAVGYGAASAQEAGWFYDPELTDDRSYMTGSFIDRVEAWDVQFGIDARITHLGIYDTGVSPVENDPVNLGVPGVAVDVTIGLWDGSGQLLAQAVVPAGKAAELDERIRYIAIEPLEVQAGEVLTFGRHIQAGNWPVSQNFEAIPGNLHVDYPDGGLQFPADLVYIGMRSEFNAPALVYPTNFSQTQLFGNVGVVNFRYESNGGDLIFEDGFE